MSTSEKDSDDADGVAGVQPSTSPEGSVPLHELCERCRELFDNWELLDLLDDGVTSSKSICSYSRELCTPVQLSQSQELCHFCAMVLSRIKDYEDWDPNKTLTLETILARKSSTHLSLNIRNNGIPRHIGLYVKRFKSNAFDSAEKTSHVARKTAANLDQIKMWFNACRSNHTVCSSWCPSLKSQEKRPARVLEVSPKSVRLRCDVQDKEIEYLTLSHMWGKDPSQQLRLLMSRLHEFQEAIPWKELPSLFKEAIRITRHMGFKYLWIDSLCIIQDSGPDWEAQAATMATVYRNAACNISFLFLPGENYIQSREDPRIMSPCVIRKATTTKKGISITPSPAYWDSLTLGPSLLQRGASRTNPRNWPLFSRAWTFQEHLLSPRTVLYGHQTIMWECAETFCDELVGTVPMSIQTRPIRKTLLSRGSRSDIGDSSSQSVDQACHIDYLRNWLDLVHGYRIRHLTKSEDRTMAFAGVAQAFQAEHGLTYLAGLWAECLPSCLLWRTKHYDTRQHAKTIGKDGSSVDPWPKEPVSEGIPSWSWFSSPFIAEGYHRPGRDSLEYSWHQYLGIRDILLHSARLTHFQWPGLTINHIPQRAFHDFSGLRISLELATITTSITKSATPFSVHECASLLAQLRSFKGVTSGSWAAYYCDDREEVEQPPAALVLALVMETVYTNRGARHLLEGLALKQTKEQDIWKRVGLWQSSIGWDQKYLDNLDSGTAVTENIAGTSTTRKRCPKTDAKSGSMNSDDFQPRRESIFMRLKGVKVETLTLV